VETVSQFGRHSDRSDAGSAVRHRGPLGEMKCGADRRYRRRITGDGNPRRGAGYPGTYRAVNNMVDCQSGTILVQALFPNPDRLLRPGM